MDVWWYSPDCIGFLLGCVPLPSLVCLFVGVFYITLFDVDMLSLLWEFHHYRGLVTYVQYSQPPLVCLFGPSLVLSDPRSNYFCQEISMASWTSRYIPFLGVGSPSELPSIFYFNGHVFWSCRYFSLVEENR